MPEKSEQERKTLIKRTLIESAKTFTECSAVWLWPIEKLTPLLIETPSTTQLKTVAHQGKEAILITPHIGAWEMVGLYCAQLTPTTCMYRPPRLAALGPLIKQGRVHLGLKLASTDQQGIRQLSRTLKQNEFIGILPDQDPGQNGGIFAPFFAKPANTMTLVSRFALKFKCPVFCVYAERLPQGRGYLIHCKEIPSEISTGSLEESVAVLNQAVENCALHLPHQYQWGYKRFKNQPAGMPDIYRIQR